MSETFFPERITDRAAAAVVVTAATRADPAQVSHTRAYGALNSTGPIHAMTIEKVPEGADLATTAPRLCRDHIFTDAASVTGFRPKFCRHWAWRTIAAPTTSNRSSN